MKILVNEKISQHKYKTPEGYLICVDSVLARTGPQTYRKNELFVDAEDDREIEVGRSPNEVFAPETLASFENKPITIEHPHEDVNIENYKDYAVGFVRDVKQGTFEGQDVILGTLVITDKDAIEGIENGEHVELSCGYDCDIEDGDDGYQQKHIRGNHVALCEAGRAGIAKIVDSVEDAVVPEAKGEYKGYTVIAKSTGNKNAPTLLELYDGNKKVKSIFSADEDLDDAIKDAKLYWPDLPLPREKKKLIENYLSMISTFTNRDTDIKDVLRPLSGKGFKYTIDKIEGWIWKKGELAYKNYYISLDDYKDKFMVTLYADPEKDWKVNEVNAYFTDSIKDKLRLIEKYNGYEIWDGQSDNKKVTYVDIKKNGEFIQSADNVKEAEKEIDNLTKTNEYKFTYLIEYSNGTTGETSETFTSTEESAKDKAYKILSKKGLPRGRWIKLINLNTNKEIKDSKTPDEEQTTMLEKDLEHFAEDAIIDVPENLIKEFERRLKNEHIKIIKKEKSSFSAYSYEYIVESYQMSFAADLKKIAKWLNDQDCTMSYSVKHIGRHEADTAKIILHKIITGDSINDAKELSAKSVDNLDELMEHYRRKHPDAEFGEIEKRKDYYVVKVLKDSIHDVDPRSGESKEDFISRFMSETKSEYPDEKQRLAVAYSYWKKAHGKDSKIKDKEIYIKLNGKISNNDLQTLLDKTIKEYLKPDYMMAASGHIYAFTGVADKPKVGITLDIDANRDWKPSMGKDLSELRQIWFSAWLYIRGSSYQPVGDPHIKDWKVKTVKEAYSIIPQVVNYANSIYEEVTKGARDSKVKDADSNYVLSYTSPKMISEDIAEAKRYGLKAYKEKIDGKIQVVFSGPANRLKDFVENNLGLDASDIRDSKPKDSIYALNIDGQSSRKLVRAKDAREAVEKYKKMFPKDKVKSVKRTDKFNKIIENIPR